VEDSAADAPAALEVVLAAVEDLVEVVPVAAAVVVLAAAVVDGPAAVVGPAAVANQAVVARAEVAVGTIMTVMLASLANRVGNKLVINCKQQRKARLRLRSIS
jgi:hypothetical protein